MVTHSLTPVCGVRYCIRSIVAVIVVSILSKPPAVAARAAARIVPHRRLPRCRRRHRADIGGAIG